MKTRSLPWLVIFLALAVSVLNSPVFPPDPSRKAAANRAEARPWMNRKNIGRRAGAEISEIYVALPEEAGEPPKRLVGWARVQLKAGESKEVTVTIDNKYLSIYDEALEAWKLVPGTYTFMAGGSSQDLPLTAKIALK